MILADKVIMLRKKNGWSQEELAEQLNVTRQSVSKWEGAQSTPDLDKILKMSQIFGVSTDYLLKDEQEEEEYVEMKQEEKFRRVSMEEANEFIAVKNWSASKIALAVFLFIISPAVMLFLGAAAELKVFYEVTGIKLTENVAGCIGLIVLFIIVAVAIGICIYCGSKTGAFVYMEKEPIDTEYGVSGMVKERRKQFKDTYTRYNIIGTSCCVLAVIPLFVVGITNENKVAVVFALPILLILVGIGVTFFIRAGIPWETFQKLLQEGAYSVEAKSNSKSSEPIVTVYWSIVTAVFFIYSFGFDAWGRSWIIWPVAGVLFAAFMAIYRMITKKEE